MVNVTNNTPRTPLGLPGGLVIEPGKTVPVPNWTAIKDNHVVKAWVKSKLLTVSGEEAAPVQAAQQAVGDEKETILAKLEALGIKKDKRTSLEKLKAALAEAEKQAAQQAETDQEAE